MFNKPFRITLSQRASYDPRTSGADATMTLRILPVRGGDAFGGALSLFQAAMAQGTWDYFSNSLGEGISIGNPAPADQQFWRWVSQNGEGRFEVLTIGPGSDGQGMVDKCVTIGNVMPGADGIVGTPNATIMHQTRLFRPGNATWTCEEDFGPGYVGKNPYRP